LFLIAAINVMNKLIVQKLYKEYLTYDIYKIFMVAYNLQELGRAFVVK